MVTLCFHCGGALKIWEFSKDPCTCSMLPTCHYVISVKGMLFSKKCRGLEAD